MAVNEISPQQFHERWKSDASKPQLIDVRTVPEFREVRASMAKSLPLSDVTADRVRKAVGSQDVFLICKSGARARQAAEKLSAEGLTSATIIVGGTEAWAAAGLPVTRDAGVMSLERQVRIAAGALVATFSLLSILVHPSFVFGALFVGCGLVFAGITNWCGMGLLIAKMPWNKGAGPSCSV